MKKYYLSTNISWKTFKLIMDKFPDSGPSPQHIDEVLWQMLREREINIGLRDSGEDPIFISLKPIPKGATLITNPKR